MAGLMATGQLEPHLERALAGGAGSGEVARAVPATQQAR